ncbi:XRE family transcriptional regulator [Coprobacter secundus]|uniref:HTH cro/C1-type domain-containing protein n=1 Tax=Coprobacter secundus subsp. similis TaxID=2751153 RepID=A0A7G1HY19_9BACT|nr:helix-turn-helix domain-containing protein [Coprobacter secundus]BCI63118.1 hypothetical protein Cop2CBH44_14710 [Coprobacter secundus subsp. similis]CCY37808.1 putative uncharacterized protein [Tannerella sp. CAG:118]
MLKYKHFPMDVRERISQIIEIKKLNKNSFSKKVGIQPQTLHHILKGRQTYPSYQVLEKIALTFTDINLRWLITGEGNMILPPQQTFQYKELEEELPSQTSDLPLYTTKNIRIPIEELTEITQKGNNPDNYNNLPFLSLPSFILNNDTFHLCTQVNDNSMFPTLPFQSYLIVSQVSNKKENISNNDIYIVIDNCKNIFIRRIRKSLKKNTIICISDNPNKSLYPDITLSLNEIDSIWHFEMLLSADLPTSLTATNNIETLQNDISDIKNTLRKFLNSEK